MARLLADTRPLRVPNFRRMWTANIVTVIGAQLTVVAVPAQIYAMTGSSAYVGLTGVFGLVPLIVFGLYGGSLADVMDRRKLLLIGTVGMIVASFGFWVLTVTGVRNVWVLLTVFALQQSFFAVTSPTRNAILPRIVPPADLLAANYLNNTVTQGGAIAGPLLGGALIPVLGFSWLYLLDALSMLATIWAVLKLPGLPPLDRAAAQAKAGFRSVLEGFAYLSTHPVLLMSFLVDIIAMVCGMPRALFPQIAHQSFGGPVDGGVAFALLFAAIPAGAVLGGVFSGWVPRIEAQGRAVIIAILGWGAAIVLLGVAIFHAGGRPGLWLWVALLALVAGGAADMVSSAFRNTMLQQAATDEVRGRLQGVFTIVVVGGPRIADVIHGGIASSAGTAVTTLGGGVLVVVLLLIASAIFPAFIRYRVPRHQPETEIA